MVAFNKTPFDIGESNIRNPPVLSIPIPKLQGMNFLKYKVDKETEEDWSKSTWRFVPKGSISAFTLTDPVQ